MQTGCLKNGLLVLFVKIEQTFGFQLNRSDSDSSMPLYRRGGPFQRNSIERRSLRWRRPPGTVLITKHHRSASSGAACRCVASVKSSDTK
jgi:protein KIBRA